MPHTWQEIIFPYKKYYQLERKHCISLHGVRKYWEVSPIVGIVVFAFGTAGFIFTTYYPWTRTDVAYTRTPGYRTVKMTDPKRCKLVDFKDYSTYKPNHDLRNLLVDMQCAEWKRYCQCKKDHIEIEYFMQRQLPYGESGCWVPDPDHL